MKRLAALAAFKLSLFWKPRADEAFFKKYSRLIAPDVTEEEVAAYPEAPEELFRDQPVLSERYGYICRLCGGDPIALTAVQLCLLALLEERTLSMLQEGFGTAGGLTIETAGRIACRDRETLDLPLRLRDAFEKVELLLQAEPGGDFLKAPFHPDGRLAAFLQGDDVPDRRLLERGAAAGRCEALPPAVLSGGAAERTAEYLRQSPGLTLVHISGEPGSGRRFFARHTARLLEKELLLVPFDAVAAEQGLLPIPWRLVQRELLLSGRLLCLWEVHGPPERLRELERIPVKRPVFLTSRPSVKTVPFLDGAVWPVQIPQPTILQSARLWRAMAAETLPQAGEGFPAEALAARMRLTAGQMARILRLLKSQRPEGPWEEREIFKLCYQVLDDGRYENIRLVNTSCTWESLQLEDRLKATLQAVCAQVEHQSLVLDGWGLRQRYPYGRCVSVLLSGPPGTGKTMAAQVLASRLGLALYQVDLSQVVDKYIGETEKRLRQVFDQAEKSNLVLFFDEADALLGKRSEVKDAKDKYANTEVAYLLQRMEEYQGVVLVATNQAGSIDAAFTRRFRYHLVFTLPEESLRRKIWADALAGIPSEGVQTDYLARQFSLSGAQIKNIVLNAAYQAAADEKVLRMDHLIRAMFQELQKEGKVLLASEFGEYGVMLNDYLAGESRRDG